MTTVAAVIIGDEILSGKVRDTNAQLLIDICLEVGAMLERVVYIGDEPDVIAREVAACSAAHDVVVTSGGIGPTHDDRTVDGVARAFAVPVVRSPEVEALIRSLWGDRFTDGALRMADMPDGATLHYGGDGLLPVVGMHNVYLLPGIPELFAAKIRGMSEVLAGARPVQRSLYLRSDESRIAPILAEVDSRFPEVKIGSYPRVDDRQHRIWVTAESANPKAVDAAVEALLEKLPATEIVRVDDEPA